MSLPIPSQRIQSGELFEYNIIEEGIFPLINGTSLNYTVSDVLPSWMSFDRETTVLAGTPGFRDIRDYSFQIFGRYTNGKCRQQEFDIRVWRNKLMVIGALITSGIVLIVITYKCERPTKSNNYRMNTAAAKGDLETVKKMHAKGADFQWKSFTFRTALQEAARNGHLDIAEYLIQHNAPVNIPGNVLPPLHEAAECGHEKVVDYLIQHGAVVDVSDHRGETALHKAARKGHVEVGKVLLDAGAISVSTARYNPSTSSKSLQVRDANPLVASIIGDHLAMTTLLWNRKVGIEQVPILSSRAYEVSTGSYTRQNKPITFLHLSMHLERFEINQFLHRQLNQHPEEMNEDPAEEAQTTTTIEPSTKSSTHDPAFFKPENQLSGEIVPITIEHELQEMTNVGSI